jgi:hypothetical protein
MKRFAGRLVYLPKSVSVAMIEADGEPGLAERGVSCQHGFYVGLNRSLEDSIKDAVNRCRTAGIIR